MSIYSKLVHIQNELKAPKSQYNSFGKYNYRNQEDILEAVKPLLLKHGLTMFLKDEIELIGERYYLKATVTVVDIETGDKVENTALARESLDKKGMDDSQITGTASSYARKYALNGMYLIDDTKDADTDAFKQQTSQQNKTTPPAQTTSNGSTTERMASESQISLLERKIKDVAKKSNVTVETVKEKMGVTDVTKLTSKQASAWIDKLKY